mmetsp:Transcript_43476/g.113158  ORF Transcript_43476/g.113158 Transcript_43476/m.113158 type:complete len:101 (-) Transcript_43476:158-460(-)
MEFELNKTIPSEGLNTITAIPDLVQTFDPRKQATLNLTHGGPDEKTTEKSKEYHSGVLLREDKHKHERCLYGPKEKFVEAVTCNQQYGWTAHEATERPNW